MKKYKIAVFVGSLRKESYNLKTAKALIALPAMAQPEPYIADASGLFDDNGNLIKEAT